MVSQKNGISALGLARELGMTRLPTGLELLKNIRKSIEDLTKHGYQHVKVKKQYDISGDDNTPLVHRVASLLKRWMLGTHQGAIHLENLQPYLDEYVFRFNRRTSASRGKLFYRLIQELLKPIEKK